MRNVRWHAEDDTATIALKRTLLERNRNEVNCLLLCGSALQNPKPLSPFGRLCERLQFSLGQLAVGDNGSEMIAHLADAARRVGVDNF